MPTPPAATAIARPARAAHRRTATNPAGSRPPGPAATPPGTAPANLIAVPTVVPIVARIAAPVAAPPPAGAPLPAPVKTAPAATASRPSRARRHRTA